MNVELPFSLESGVFLLMRHLWPQFERNSTGSGYVETFCRVFSINAVKTLPFCLTKTSLAPNFVALPNLVNSHP